MQRVGTGAAAPAGMPPIQGTVGRADAPALPVLHGNTRQARRVMMMHIHVQRTVFKRLDLPAVDAETPYEDVLDTYYKLTGVSNAVQRIETMKKAVWSMFFVISAVNDMFKRPLKLRGMMTSLDKSLEQAHTREMLYKISLKWFKEGRSSPEFELLLWLGGLVLGTAVKNGGFGDVLSHVPYLNSMLGLAQTVEEEAEDDKLSGTMRFVSSLLGKDMASKLEGFLNMFGGNGGNGGGSGSGSGGSGSGAAKEGGSAPGDILGSLLGQFGLGGGGVQDLLKTVMSATEEEEPKPRRRRRIPIQRAKPLSDDAISTTAAEPTMGGGDDMFA